jgi:hypothetical protein
MTPLEIETLKEIFRAVVKEEFVHLEQKFDVLEEKSDLFHEEVEYKFDVVFDELYAIRTSMNDSDPASKSI